MFDSPPWSLLCVSLVCFLLPSSTFASVAPATDDFVPTQVFPTGPFNTSDLCYGKYNGTLPPPAGYLNKTTCTKNCSCIWGSNATKKENNKENGYCVLKKVWHKQTKRNKHDSPFNFKKTWQCVKHQFQINDGVGLVLMAGVAGGVFVMMLVFIALMMMLKYIIRYFFPSLDSSDAIDDTAKSSASHAEEEVSLKSEFDD